MPTAPVIDSHLAYTETGAGDLPVVFLHGSPTSSYIWRHVIPHVSGQARVLAPVVVGHDWGGALAMDWAARHPAACAASH
jgi:haloalkane dehalogenase